MELFDSHAHYNDEKFKQDEEQILKQIYENGITKVICAGYSLPASKQAVKIAEQYDFVYAIVGISPNDIPPTKAISKKQIEEQNDNNTKENESLEEFRKQLDSQLQEIEELAKHQKVVAIGEIGLDYYWNKENKQEQKLAFQKQIELANKLQLPIVIHTREAISDTIDILKNQAKVLKKGIFHCCPQNAELIKEGLKLGFYISFAGPITFKNSKNAEEAIKLVPLDKLLIETDSPYLAPEPKRGTRNDSSNVKYVAEKIAQVRGMTTEEIARITYENAMQIFEINAQI